MRKKKPKQAVLLLGLILVVSIILIGIRLLLSSPMSEAKAIVNQFYSFEQNANFSGSWNLFHPYIKEKFPKAAYIQDRSHVFIGHFGSETFTYKIGDGEEVEEWKASEETKPFKRAYKFIVIQSYSGKYGKFSFMQEVYVVKYKKEWVILWNFNH
jgi:predicted small secreted protein